MRELSRTPRLGSEVGDNPQVHKKKDFYVVQGPKFTKKKAPLDCVPERGTVTSKLGFRPAHRS